MSPGAVWWCGPLRRGPAAHRALLPHEGGAEACRGTRRCPCASGRRRGAGTRRIMSEALNSDSTNSASFLLLTFVAASGRLSQSQVAGLRYSDQFAHGGDGVIAFFAADEPCGARSPMFSREEGSRFFKNSHLCAQLAPLRLQPGDLGRLRGGLGVLVLGVLLLVLGDPAPPPSAEPGRRRRPRTRSCVPSPGSRERPAP